MGRHHPQTLFAEVGLAPRGWTRKGPAPRRQQPGPGSQSVPGWSEGSGLFRQLCRSRRRVPLPPCSLRTFSAAASRASSWPWRSSRSDASYLIPLRRRRPSPLVTRGLPVRRAWLPGLAFGIGFCFVLMFWMRVVGCDAWLALSALEALVLRPRWAWSCRGPARSAGLAGRCGRGRLGGDGGGPRRLAVRRHALGPARLRHRRTPRGPTALAVRRQQRRQLPARPARHHAGLVVVTPGRAPAGPGRWPRWAVARRLPWSPALAPYSAGRSPTTATVAVVQGNVPGDGDDILYDHRQVTQNHVDATVGWPTRSRPATSPQPDFVLWPENSTAVDPFDDAEHPRRDPAGVRRDRRTDPGRRDRRRRARARAQPGHRLGPRHRGRGPLHQAAPGAVRRVHPVAQHLPGQLRPAGADPARHAQRHPHRAARGRRHRGRRRDLLRRGLRRRHPRTSSQTAPSCSSCRPATRPSSTPTRSTSSSRSPGCGRSRPAATSLVAATNGVSGVIAPDGTRARPRRPADPGRAGRAGRAVARR